MLSLVTRYPEYINDAAAEFDFEFLVEAVTANEKCFWYMKDAKAARKVAQALSRGSDAQKYYQSIKCFTKIEKEATCSIL